MFKNKKFANAIFILATVSSIIYLVWRAIFTLPLHNGAVSLVFGILLLGSEIAAALGTYELYWRKSHLNKMDLKRPDIPLDWYPDVDVLIATHNESVELLYKTVNAITYLDYPDKRKVHVFISDDGNRPEVAKLAETLKVGYIGLADNKQAKSGNYNNALRHTSSPLVATFDADMIVRHDFLMETVPYFYLPRVKKLEDGTWALREESEIDQNYRIGFIQTPQSFYNPDLFQFNLYAERNIPNEQDFFSREINVMRNSSNAVAYTGSNTVLSRAALDEIGGFPTDTITEDFETGIRIQAKGYTAYSTSEPLASGLAPTSIKSMVTQRVRWARGVIQSIRNTKLLTNKGLPVDARISYMVSYSYWWSFARRLVFTFAPIMFALFNQQVVITTFWQIMAIWAPSYIFYSLAMRSLSSDTRNQRWNQIIDTILAPFMVIPVFLETIGIRQKKFKVTDKNSSKPQTSNLVYIIPQLIMLGLSVAGLVRYLSGKYGMALLYSSFIAFWLIYNIINLLYAVYFMMGRKAYRTSERFSADIPLQVEYNGQNIHAVTRDISEGGFLFTLVCPLYLPNDEDLRFTLRSDRYRADVTGKIIYINSEKNQWLYHVKLTGELAGEEKRQYLQLVYDRVPSLPKSMNVWVTAFDDIVNNASVRLEKQRFEMRSLPRVDLERKAAFEEGGAATLVNFNYKYFLVRDLTTNAQLLTIEPKRGVRIVLEPTQLPVYRTGEKLMRVVNWQELSRSKAFQEVLDDWIFEYGQRHLGQSNHGKLLPQN
ncbi:MAG TPA: glycosyltransferase family 2 protein [Candidatus Cryosericum sp.]|nr:glycosyltransferase family 2 protein [Candidatus Cryosericum sp.]